MSEVLAGKIGVTNGGEWNAETYYEEATFVRHKNNLYLSNLPSTGVEPTNEEYWMLAMEGFSGEDVQTLIDSINNIINGTTQVGNAKTLDGHEAEYFFPKIGGEIDGFTKINGQNITPFSIVNTKDNEVYIAYSDINGLLGLIGFDEANKPVFYKNDWSAKHYLLHTGNKPTGTYTGNGSTVARNISIGGVGEVLIVAVDKGGGNFGVSVITKKCALVCDENGARTIPGAVFGVYAGTLSISTDNANLNASGVTYDYWLL